MNAPALSASIAGIGFWACGLPSWTAACAFAADGLPSNSLPSNSLPSNGMHSNGMPPVDAPARPSPQLLAPNERRRAPETVAVALEVALAACQAAGRDPATLSSVFASTHGDLSITDYMCETLASEPRALSPTRFHNSVHNAAAGYWTIGTGAMAPATAISAHDASFAQGLLEALAQLATGADSVLLVGYDSRGSGPLGHVSRSEGLLGGALVLSRDALPGTPRLQARLQDASTHPPGADGPLAHLAAGNAMSPMLPLFDALARRQPHTAIAAGSGKVLRMEIAYD